MERRKTIPLLWHTHVFLRKKKRKKKIADPNQPGLNLTDFQSLSIWLCLPGAAPLFTMFQIAFIDRSAPHGKVGKKNPLRIYFRKQERKKKEKKKKIYVRSRVVIFPSAICQATTTKKSLRESLRCRPYTRVCARHMHVSDVELVFEGSLFTQRQHLSDVTNIRIREPRTRTL